MMDVGRQSTQEFQGLQQKVRRGIELLQSLEHEQLSLADTMDRLEVISRNPSVTRKILDTAEKRGAIKIEETTVVPTSNYTIDFESDIIEKRGEFDCQRCGHSLSTGYFIQLRTTEHGPFGSTCIRKVTGRE